MATIIDSLLITMGMDTSAYRKGQREVEDGARKVNEAERNRGKESAAASKAMAEGFRVARNELMSLVGIALGATGIKQFFANMVTSQAVLGRVAKDIGMNARELDAWGKAAESAGGSAEGLQGSLQSIQGGFEEFRLTGKSSVVDAFRAMQVELTGADGKLRPMNDLLLDLSKSMQKMTPQEQIRLSKMLGIDQGTLDLLRMAPADLSRTVEQMRQASRVTDESTAAAKRAQAEWSKLKSELKGVGEEVFVSVIPGLTQVGTALAKNIHDLMTWLHKYTSIKEAAAAIKNSIQATAEYAMSGGVTASERTRKSSAAGELRQFDNDFKPYAKAGRVGTEKGRGGSGGSDFDAFVKAAAAELDVPPALMWGKIRNEVGWKNSTVGDFNFGNVKAGPSWKGAVKEKEVWENIGGKDVMRKEAFRSYGSIAEASADYVKMMRNSFPKVAGATSGAEFTDALKNGKYGSYATDPNYASKIMATARRAPAEFGGGSTTTTTIQSLTINTKATDAPGIARSLSDELNKSQKLSFGAAGMR